MARRTTGTACELVERDQSSLYDAGNGTPIKGERRNVNESVAQHLR